MPSRLTRTALAAALLVPEALALGAAPALARTPASGSDAPTWSGVPAAEAAGPVDGAVEVHEGTGVVVVEGRHPSGAHEVHYVVRLTWSGDGHPAGTDTALTATVLGPAGPVATVPFQSYDADGRFHARVAYPGPGVWTLRFTAGQPPTSHDSVEPIPVPSDVLNFV